MNGRDALIMMRLLLEGIAKRRIRLFKPAALLVRERLDSLASRSSTAAAATEMADLSVRAS